MSEPAGPIASSSSSKTQKTPKKPKGKARQDKVVSPNAATRPVDSDPTTPARTHAHAAASQGSSVPAASSTPSTPSSDRDGIDSVVGEFGEFDYDAVRADDGVELWLIRAPSNVKARHLRGLEINSSRTGLVGDLLRRGTAYDLWTLDPAAAAAAGSGGARAHGESASGDQDEVGGATPSSPIAAAAQVGVDAEELDHLSVLLPCKRKSGKLYLVQKPVTRHLVVAARPAKPTRPDAALEAPKREAYPDEALTHRFRPYGDPGDLPPQDPMDVEMVEASPKGKERTKRRSGEPGSSKKKKAKLGASQ